MNVYFLMYIKFDYFYFSAFDLELKATKISKHILPFSVEKYDMGDGQFTKF